MCVCVCVSKAGHSFPLSQTLCKEAQHLIVFTEELHSYTIDHTHTHTHTSSFGMLILLVSEVASFPAAAAAGVGDTSSGLSCCFFSSPLGGRFLVQGFFFGELLCTPAKERGASGGSVLMSNFDFKGDVGEVGFCFVGLFSVFSWDEFSSCGVSCLVVVSFKFPSSPGISSLISSAITGQKQLYTLKYLRRLINLYPSRLTPVPF